MNGFRQGDIIKIQGFKNRFLIISKNAFITATGVFHVCPFLTDIPAGPLSIPAVGNLNETGTAVCEQIKLIDPAARNCRQIDSLKYKDIMNISDAIQGIFEYD